MIQRWGLAFLISVSVLLGAAAPDGSLVRASAMVSGLPLRFEQNQGQWSREVRYAARSGSGRILFTEHGPVLSAGGRRVEVTLLGGLAAPRVEAVDPLPVRTDYFLGLRENWHTAVPNFQRVAYRSVYRGVDVVYYGTRDLLEYDFVLQPGADPRSIRLRFRGADRVSLTAEGDLAVEAASAAFVQKKPVIYQEDPRSGGRRLVAGNYEKRAGGVVGVRLDAYDRTLPLVIDPVLKYSSFLGGGVTDGVTAVQVDSKGRMVVAGFTGNSDLQFTPDAMQVSNLGSTNCFVAIFDTTKSAPNSLVYLTYLGGDRDNSPTAIFLDKSDNIWLTGTTTGSMFPVAGNSVQTKLSLGTTSTVFLPDAFVAEIFPNQPLLYGTYLGGTGSETPYGISVDQNGFIYIAGTTTSTDYPVTSQAYQSTLTGTQNLFLAKLDPNSTSLNYSTYLGGEASDDGRALAVTPSGLVYFAGTTSSTMFPMAGASYNTSLLGFENLVAGVLDMTQSGTAGLIYSTYLGGSTLDELRGMVVDSKGRMVLTGWTLSTDFPTTANAFQPTGSGAGQAIVARVNPNALPSAFLEYSTYLGGTGGDVAYGVASDATGLLYVTGYTLSSDFPVTADAAQKQASGGIEAFLVKLNPAVSGHGALLYGTYLGGTGVHFGQGVAVAKDGTMYVGGTSTSDFQAGGYQPDYGGGSADGFVVAVK